jgi:hypothetical protein
MLQQCSGRNDEANEPRRSSRELCETVLKRDVGQGFATLVAMLEAARWPSGEAGKRSQFAKSCDERLGVVVGAWETEHDAASGTRHLGGHVEKARP